MATTHVFVVDTRTFKIHLEYLFAGTGSRNDVIDFNNFMRTSLPYQKENNLLGMIADSQRIRKGDYVIFYLQQNKSQRVYEGKFFGIFMASDNFSFLDNNNYEQYLRAELDKSLTFRIKIKPFEVYAKGVTEWEALDEISRINSPYQMLWSLIYRKLKGNRGNTMITIYESDRLFKLLRDKNEKNIVEGTGFSFDFNKQEIIKSFPVFYSGRREVINIFPRLENKYLLNQAFETHLQAYIIQHLGIGQNMSLDECVLGGLELEWLGNEVSCGVGMQRIDILTSLRKSNSRIIQAIELKATTANCSIVHQLQRYIDWLEQYYIPNRISDIQPLIIAKKAVDKTQKEFQDLIQYFLMFNTRNNTCYPIKYIEYSIIDHQLVFEIFNYT